MVDQAIGVSVAWRPLSADFSLENNPARADNQESMQVTEQAGPQTEFQSIGEIGGKSFLRR